MNIDVDLLALASGGFHLARKQDGAFVFVLRADAGFGPFASSSCRLHQELRHPEDL